MYLFVGGVSEPQSTRKQDRSAVKEQVTGKTTRGMGIRESKRQTVIERWVTRLLGGSSRVTCALVKPWAKAEFRAAHHLALGLGQVLGMLQTVKGQSYIHQATTNAGGHKWNVWCGLMPFPHQYATPYLTLVQKLTGS